MSRYLPLNRKALGPRDKARDGHLQIRTFTMLATHGLVVKPEPPWAGLAVLCPRPWLPKASTCLQGSKLIVIRIVVIKVKYE